MSLYSYAVTMYIYLPPRFCVFGFAFYFALCNSEATIKFLIFPLLYKTITTTTTINDILLLHLSVGDCFAVVTE